MKELLVFDIETLKTADEVKGGWNNIYGFGFGTAVVYSYSSSYHEFYGPDEKELLIKRLTDTIVIGFNSIGFDNKILFADGEVPWQSYDIFLKILKAKYDVDTLEEAIKTAGGKWKVLNGSINLGAVSSSTLGIKKTGNGIDAPQLIRDEKWKEVYEYNLHDVQMTKKLYDFIKTYKYIVDGNFVKIKF